MSQIVNIIKYKDYGYHLCVTFARQFFSDAFPIILVTRYTNDIKICTTKGYWMFSIRDSVILRVFEIIFRCAYFWNVDQPSLFYRTLNLLLD